MWHTSFSWASSIGEWQFKTNTCASLFCMHDFDFTCLRFPCKWNTHSCWPVKSESVASMFLPVPHWLFIQTKHNRFIGICLSTVIFPSICVVTGHSVLLSWYYGRKSNRASNYCKNTPLPSLPLQQHRQGCFMSIVFMIKGLDLRLNSNSVIPLDLTGFFVAKIQQGFKNLSSRFWWVDWSVAHP